MPNAWRPLQGGASIATSIRASPSTGSGAAGPIRTTDTEASGRRISLKPDGAGTWLTLHHEQFFDEAARDGHQRGWNDILGRLERYLA
ncbi:SRPBCC domain-containing protein [Bradyrhizobium sediminis]|uniref:SRPBCC domain-containing protein n=1 Tax=Bradyrhizobium sediminis TaxID=2840469 RepID=A0A975RMW1_9BRAD|nr:SRPBCC domain-containing protein [Bradyrhizobium sediminis]QWG13169.1 SRPBCC domain-containing protein [Bradyrhizobium sediminis]